jgi:hypothetical protein
MLPIRLLQYRVAGQERVGRHQEELEADSNFAHCPDLLDVLYAVVEDVIRNLADSNRLAAD